MRLALLENLAQAEGYCHQKGIFPAREAVVMDTQDARHRAASRADDVFMGNGVSELILMTHGGAARTPGDEVLLPAPGLSAVDRGGRPDRRRRSPSTTSAGRRTASFPTPRRSRALITAAHAGAGPRQSEQSHRRRLSARGRRGAGARSRRSSSSSIFSDEIYDRILYDGATHTPSATLCERHALRHLRRALQGVPRLRLPHRLGVLQRRARPRRRVL